MPTPHDDATGRGCERNNCMTRREFVLGGTALLALATIEEKLAIASEGKQWWLNELAKYERLRGAVPLKLQPVLVYSLSRRPLRPRSSWRPWGGFETEKDVEDELSKIGAEVSQLKGLCKFPIEVLPTEKVRNPNEAQALKESKADVFLIYAAGAWVDTYQALVELGKWSIIFVRFKSGRYYLWHEIVHPRFLRKHTDQLMQTAVGYEDVVVDDIKEVAWRLHALYGLKNALNRKIVCIGGAGAWAGGAPVVERAKQLWKFDMIVVPIPDLVKLIEEKRKDPAVMEMANLRVDPQRMRHRV